MKSKRSTEFICDIPHIYSSSISPYESIQLARRPNDKDKFSFQKTRQPMFGLRFRGFAGGFPLRKLHNHLAGLS